MKYLKYFKEASAYEAYKNGSDYVLPNVSYIKETKSVSYEPYVELPFKMIDLGLPSGLLWADRNIGASNPDEVGLYFQWGDTVGYTTEQITNGEKEFSAQFSDYFDATVDGRNVTFNKYNFDGGFTVLQPEDDAATVNMGAEYRMPTKANFEELINNCTLAVVDTDGNEYEVIGGKVKIEGKFKGVKFTGSNGNSIFIPLSYCVENRQFTNDYCYLWSSMLSETTYYTAIPLIATSTGTVTIYNAYRTVGMPIRGVCIK
jgi:hypothetical protein